MGMNFKKYLKTIAVCTVLLGCLSIQSPVFAAECNIDNRSWRGMEVVSKFDLLGQQRSSLIAPRATETFRINLSGNSQTKASSSFSMAANEPVSITAAFSPASAILDIGLIDSDGSFYYFSVTGGTVNKTIWIPENGSYTLGIRNNSSDEIDISGYVNY